MVDYAKLKTNLNLIIHRLKLVEKKKIELNQKARRQIGEFLNTGKTDRARIRVEQIIREDYLIEAMDILESYCDLILSRFGQLQSSKEIDEGLQTAISSIIWIAPRLESDVSELKTISEQLSLKYGKQYIAAVRDNQLRTVNETLMRKVNVQAPPKVLVEQYLVEIAKDQKIDYKPDPLILKEHEAMGSGGHHHPLSVPSIDDLDDHHHRPGGSTQPPQTGFNLIDLGDHYPASLQPLNPFGQPPPLPKAQPHGAAASAGVDIAEGPSAPTGMMPIGFNLTGVNSDAAQAPSKPEKPTDGSSTKPPGLIKGNSTEAPPPNYDAVMNNSTTNPKAGPSSTNFLASTSIKPGNVNESSTRPNFNDTLAELPSVPPGLPDITDTSLNQASSGGTDDRLDFEDLARRFEELKNRK